MCPECKADRIVKIRLSTDVKAFPLEKAFSLGSFIIGEACASCGLIINLRLEKPEKFRK